MRVVEIFVIGNERQKLVLGPEFSAEFSKQSPVFDFDGVPGSVSIGVDIPVEGNEATLKQAHRIETENRALIFDIEYWKGELQFYGKLIIEESVLYSENDTFSVDIVKGDLPTQITGVKLRDILTEDITIAEGLTDIYTAMKQQSEAVYPDNPLSFPTYFNDDHFGGRAEYFDGWINPWIQTVSLFEQIDTLQNGDLYYKPGHTFSPWLNLMWLIKRVFHEYGYTIRGTFEEDPQARKISHVTNFSIEQFKDGDRSDFRTDQDRTLPQGWVPFDEVVDSTNDGSNPTNIQLFPINHRGRFQVVANINAGAFSGSPTIHIKTNGPNGTGVQFNLVDQNQVTTFEGEFTAEDADVGDYLAVFIEHSGTVDININTTLRIHNLTESTGFEFKRSVPLAHLVPDMTIAAFVKAIRGLGVKIVIDDLQKEVILDWQSGAFSGKRIRPEFTNREIPIENPEQARYNFSFSKAEELPDLSKYIGSFPNYSSLGVARTGEIAHVQSHGALYVYEVDQTLDKIVWKYLGKEQQFILSGEGDEKSLSVGFVVPSSQLLTRTGQDFLCTVLNQRGSGEAYGLKVEKGELTLAFYHGMQSGSEGTYPMGSAFSLDMFGTSLSEYSLSCFQGDGIYFKEWQRLLSILQSARAVVKNVYHNQEIAKNPFDVIIREDHQDYLVSEITTEEGNAEVPLQLRLVKI